MQSREKSWMLFICFRLEIDNELMLCLNAEESKKIRKGKLESQNSAFTFARWITWFGVRWVACESVLM